MHLLLYFSFCSRSRWKRRSFVCCRANVSLVLPFRCQDSTAPPPKGELDVGWRFCRSDTGCVPTICTLDSITHCHQESHTELSLGDANPISAMKIIYAVRMVPIVLGFCIVVIDVCEVHTLELNGNGLRTLERFYRSLRDVLYTHIYIYIIKIIIIIIIITHTTCKTCV